MENEMLSLLQDIFEEVEPMLGMGKVADYIPALATVNPRQFGISICDTQGRITSIGDASVPFSIQSISKVFNLVLAINHYGETMWDRVGCVRCACVSAPRRAAILHKFTPKSPISLQSRLPARAA